MTFLEIAYDDYYTPKAVELCRAFAAGGGDINAREPGSEYTLLWIATEHMNLDLIAVLGELGADPNCQLRHSGWTPVHNAVDADIDSVMQAQPPDMTALCDLVTFSVTRAVVSIGGSIAVPDVHGITPLMLAREYDTRLGDKLLKCLNQ